MSSKGNTNFIDPVSSYNLSRVPFGTIPLFVSSEYPETSVQCKGSCINDKKTLCLEPKEDLEPSVFWTNTPLFIGTRDSTGRSWFTTDSVVLYFNVHGSGVRTVRVRSTPQVIPVNRFFFYCFFIGPNAR